MFPPSQYVETKEDLAESALRRFISTFFSLIPAIPRPSLIIVLSLIRICAEIPCSQFKALLLVKTQSRVTRRDFKSMEEVQNDYELQGATCNLGSKFGGGDWKDRRSFFKIVAVTYAKRDNVHLRFVQFYL
jgi:hypothetical protein